MNVILMYVPVIQKGYLDFVNSHPEAYEVCIWGESLIEQVPRLKKEIRAITPDQAQLALSILIERPVRIIELNDLISLARVDRLIVPNDEISRNLIESNLRPMGLKSFQFDPVFLRWESQSASQALSVNADETISLLDLGKVYGIALDERDKSSDWWRKVGAVLFDNDKNIVLFTHNIHLPTDYGPYISGDPRAAFSKGVQIELSTASHAEAGLIANAARMGLTTLGLNLLTTTFPCPVCAKLIATSGISNLYFCEGYSMIESEEVLRNAGVKIIRVV